MKTNANNPIKSIATFLSLCRHFFIYLSLLTKPHERRLFMAGLTQQHSKVGASPVIVSIYLLLIAAPFFSLNLLLPMLFADSHYSYRPSLPIIFLAPLFSYGTYFSSLNQPFLLRYSHYAQTPQFQDKTKRRQILMLDAVKSPNDYLIDDKNLVVWLLPWLPFLALDAVSSLFSFDLYGALSFSALLIFILFSFVFPFATDALFAQLSRNFLYRLHLIKHGSMSQELQDLVDRAHDLYPEEKLPKRKQWFKRS